MKKHRHLEEAIGVLSVLGMPKAQQNTRTACCLLALLGLTKDSPWSAVAAPLVGITPMMEFARENYGMRYAPNTRETFRRNSIHQMCQAGFVLANPDDPARPTNSPKAVYQIESGALDLLRCYGSADWESRLAAYLARQPSLAQRYAKERHLALVPVRLAEGGELLLSPGGHSALIAQIVRDFGPRFVPGAELLYIGDTRRKWAYFDQPLLASLKITIDEHGKMPDVVFYVRDRNWLVLVEAVTSHGPMNSKRHAELASIFAIAGVGLVFVTAFPTRRAMTRYLSDIAWETEVWVAEAPEHMIHFNGSRFLGPYNGT